MKYIKITLKIFLFLFLITLIMSFVGKRIVVDTFSQEILSKKISVYVLDEIIHDIDINEIKKIDYDIVNNKLIKEITSKFIYTVTENVIYNKNINLDIKNEVDNLISQNMYNYFSDEKIQEIKTYVVEKIVSIQENLQGSLLSSFSDKYLIVLQLFNYGTNFYFRLVIFILFFINAVILCFIEKIKVIKSFKIINLLVLLFMLVILVCIKMLSNLIDQKMSGGWLQDINIDALIIGIVVVSIICVLFFLLDRVIKLKCNKQDRKITINN